jgi:hypothetical protein
MSAVVLSCMVSPLRRVEIRSSGATLAPTAVPEHDTDFAVGVNGHDGHLATL